MLTDPNDLPHYRARQSRLTSVMNEQNLDWVVLVKPEHVQYVTGARFSWVFDAVAAISASGEVVLVAPEGRLPKVHAADRVESFAARWHSTLRNDQADAAMDVLTQALSSDLGTNLQGATNLVLGVEYSTWPAHLPWPGRREDIEPAMYRLRRCKDEVDLFHLCRAIGATESMYARAREIIRPGINELDVFNELQSTAVRHLGEMLTATGNDYQCASRGGPPRDRQAQAGELYILDLGPAYRGYFADNARTIAVTEPSAAQLEAWRQVIEVFEIVEADARPGVSARALFDKVQAHLDNCSRGVFNHHLGHGIGLFPHEAPHLNPHWEDQFEVGDVFTAEPGVYGDELLAGMRIENDYLVTENGVERLTNFPLELML